MQWGRAKTVLIALLLGVNLFLAMFIAETQTARGRLSEEYIADTVRLLDRRGLSVAKEDFYAVRLRLPTLTFSTEGMLDGLVTGLLGEVHEMTSTEEGSLYRRDGNRLLRTGATDFVYSPAQPIGEEELLSTLERAGFPAEEFLVTEKGLVLTVEGVEVADYGVRLEEGALHGRLLRAEHLRRRNDSLLDTANALLALSEALSAAGQIPCTVTGIAPVYLAELSGLSNEATLRPGYRVVVEGGGVWYVEAASGEVSAEAMELVSAKERK
ncbi:MAG: hypothetical protein IJF59_04830 [Clostridia bacterium]|nr:hypothetical protein [Clostridia bacterium]